MTGSKSNPRHLLTLPLIATAVAALLCLWTAWCEFPIYSWNEARLAPAFALRDGLNPYPLIGGGPLLTWIYGPVGIFINLPATLAGSAEGALHLASLINFTVLFLPLAFIFRSSADLKVRSPAAPWFALAVAVLLTPRPNLVFQVADHAAIAFGLLSCWSLVRQPRPANFHLVVAALLCSLAIWSKQVTVFLVGAQIAYLFLTANRVAIPRYLLWLTVLNLAALGLAVLIFGWANLWLNLVAIPGRLPWAGDIAARLAMRPWALIAQIGLPSIGLPLLWIKGKWPQQTSESGRFFQMTALVFIALLPVGFAAFFKVGGGINSFHSWDYLLPGALLAWLAKDENAPKARYGTMALAAFAIAIRLPDVISFPTKPFVVHLEAAERLMKTHPHRLWFPHNPIITYYADGKLWHSEDGVQTRSLANYGLREADFRRHLPPNLEGIAYPATGMFSFSLMLLPEFDRSIKEPHWILHVRSTPLPDKAQK